jgi:hypothetical protein
MPAALEMQEEPAAIQITTEPREVRVQVSVSDFTLIVAYDKAETVTTLIRMLEAARDEVFGLLLEGMDSRPEPVVGSAQRPGTTPGTSSERSGDGTLAERN